VKPSQAENKFKCPCHGSQYNAEGKVVRGPAPLVSSSRFSGGIRLPAAAVLEPARQHVFCVVALQSLALAHADVSENGTVLFSTW
jgi:cytochrome b6-f complex iron-sulfur subunit